VSALGHDGLRCGHDRRLVGRHQVQDRLERVVGDAVNLAEDAEIGDRNGGEAKRGRRSGSGEAVPLSLRQAILDLLERADDTSMNPRRVIMATLVADTEEGSMIALAFWKSALKARMNPPTFWTFGFEDETRA
jgi:hypothetical protein